MQKDFYQKGRGKRRRFVFFHQRKEKEAAEDSILRPLFSRFNLLIVFLIILLLLLISQLERRSLGDISFALPPASENIKVMVTVPMRPLPPPPALPPLPAPPPSAGGGGVVPLIFVSQATFEGIAEPNAFITIKKDGAIIATFLADSRARFRKTITGLPSGFYYFSIFSIDEYGRTSVALNFRIELEADTVSTISNIFIPPTIAAGEVKLPVGQPFYLYGQSAPESLITLQVEPDKILRTTFTDIKGVWTYNFDTFLLKPGDYNIKASALTSRGEASAFGEALDFSIFPKEQICRPADLNCDGRINLTDFSILLYWWKRSPALAPRVDINQDGRIDLIDLSIMLYWWGK